MPEKKMKSPFPSEKKKKIQFATMENFERKDTLNKKKTHEAIN